MNGGTCVDGIDKFTCSCPPQITGVLCECLILTNNTLDCNYLLTTTESHLTATEGISVTTLPSRTTSEEIVSSYITSEVPTTATETTKITQRAEQTEITQEITNATSTLTDTTLPPSSLMMTTSSLTTIEEATSLTTFFTAIFELENITITTEISESLPDSRSFGSTSTTEAIENTTLTEEPMTIDVHSSSRLLPMSSTTTSFTKESITINPFTAASEKVTEYTTTTSYSNSTIFTSIFPEVSSIEETITTSTLREISDTAISSGTTSTTDKRVADESTLSEMTSLPTPTSESINSTLKSSTQTISEILPTVTVSSTIFFEFETTTEKEELFETGTTNTTTGEGRTEGRGLVECGNDISCQDRGICTVAPGEQEVGFLISKLSVGSSVIFRLTVVL